MGPFYNNNVEIQQRRWRYEYVVYMLWHWPYFYVSRKRESKTNFIFEVNAAHAAQVLLK